jgi:pyruvate formate lyase activating enzyme
MMTQAPALRQRLLQRTREADPRLAMELGEGRLQCLACGHRCRIPVGHDGICKVRSNVDGELRVPFGYATSVQVDPVEKKPFFHVLPGERALSFGMLGCDLHCAYCQNWITSQALRDPEAGAGIVDLSAEDLVAQARSQGSRIVVSTYNEPLITAEWAMAVFEKACEEGLLCGFVSNGNATPEVLELLRPVTRLFKVDLKSFDDRRYRSLGGVLDNVLRTLENLVEHGFWVEVVTLVTPAFNDGDDELRSIARFLAGLDPQIPWHVTGFMPQYRMEETPPTPVSTLARAREIGQAEGLHFVYVGNRPGQIEGGEDTWCPGCNTRLVARLGYSVEARPLREGRCPDCGAAVAGIWQLP